MRIGELAEAVGVSTRAVRHYHRTRLARVRRLTELGLSLDEAADVLADDEGRELGEILAEIDADLARQEVEIGDAGSGWRSCCGGRPTVLWTPTTRCRCPPPSCSTG
jgi:DNA-binding transcriptional MerR regulator